MYRLAFLAIVLVSAPALAGRRHRHTPGVQEDELKQPSEIEPSVAAGAMLPWSIGARHERQGILIGGYGGVDQSKRAPIETGVLDATFYPNLTFRAVTVNAGETNQLVSSFGLLFDVMREQQMGLDLALGGAYEMDGFNRVPAVVTQTAVGTTLGLTRLQANAGLGIGLERGERYGDLRLSGLHPVAQALYAGVDSRARMDLNRQMNEAPGDIDFDFQAGPVMQLAVGRFEVSAHAGMAGWKEHFGQTMKVGAMGALGVGAAF